MGQGSERREEMETKSVSGQFAIADIKTGPHKLPHAIGWVVHPYCTCKRMPVQNHGKFGVFLTLCFGHVSALVSANCIACKLIQTTWAL
eukprot:3865735-Amphidinium_carterae.1